VTFGRPITWSTSDSTVVTVFAEGYVHATAVGTATNYGDLRRTQRLGNPHRSSVRIRSPPDRLDIVVASRLIGPP